MRTAELDYELPDSCIATHPAVPRDAARLLVAAASTVEHAIVADLPRYLRRGDLLVVNTSKVIPARLVGIRADTRGKAEGLWLGIAEAREDLWRVLIKARRIKPGMLFALHDRAGRESGIALRLIARSQDSGEDAAWTCELLHARTPGLTSQPQAKSTSRAIDVLDRVGHVPLPPYIRAARKRASEQDEAPSDADEYQCVYADRQQAGSVAAPTAGLHFTPDLLARLAAQGVELAEVVLHVGTGTFKPIETELLSQHPMHSEWCELPARTAQAIVNARANGKRVIAVGTTTARTLESFGPVESLLTAGARGWTKLLIAPGHQWQNLDGLLTNFHLPRSTLLALVAAKLPGGIEQLRGIYRQAIDSGYRFYSFGDAMLIV